MKTRAIYDVENDNMLWSVPLRHRVYWAFKILVGARPWVSVKQYNSCRGFQAVPPPPDVESWYELRYGRNTAA